MPRGRPKKDNDLPINISADREPEQQPGSSSQTQRKSVTRVEKWSEEVPSQQQSLIYEEEPEIEEERHPFDIVLDDFGPDTNEGYIKVYRLPEYQKRGIASPKNAVREWCEDLPATPEYLSIIKENWGPGVYQLELRDKIGFRRRKTVCIAAPTFPAAQNGPRNLSGTQTSMVMNPQGPGVSYELPDPMKQFDQMIDMVSKFRKAFGVTLDQPVQNLQRELKEDNEDSFLKSLMTIAMADDKMKAEAIGGVRGLIKGNGGPHEPGTNDLILAAINILPAIFDKAEGFITRILSAKGVVVNGQTEVVQAPVPQSHQGTGWPMDPSQQGQTFNPGLQPRLAGNTAMLGTQPAQPTASPSAPSISQQEQIINFVLQELLKACQENKHMLPVTNWLFQMEEKYPDLITPMIEEFSNKTPDEVIAYLNSLPEGSRYTSLPHCRTWIENLQKTIKESTDPAPEEGDQNSE